MTGISSSDMTFDDPFGNSSQYPDSRSHAGLLGRQTSLVINIQYPDMGPD